MTTLQDRSEHGPAGSPLEDAYCPHCGGHMASAVSLPWPDQPTMCPSCQRWVGRARAVGAGAAEGGAEPNGSSSASQSGRGEKRGRPGSAERRRARELARGASPGAVAAPDAQVAPEESHGAAASEAAAEPEPAATPTPNGATGEEVADEGAFTQAPEGAGDAAPAEATALGPGAAGDETVVDGASTSEGSPDAQAAAPAGNGAPAGPFPAPDPAHTVPFAPLVEEPRRRRLRLPRLRRRSAEQAPAPASPLSAPPGPERPRRSRLLRALPFVLLVIGGLLLVEGAVTVLWKEPFSALLTAQSQGELGDKLRQMEEQAAAEEAQNRRQLARYQHRRAVQVNRSTSPGEPLGRLRIPKLDLSKVVVQSTAESSLTKGPAHYTETPLPGQRGNWTVGIAGHRTTYDAPFRRINELKRGNKIIFTLPYGRFTYEVSKTRIVDAGYLKAFVPQGKKMIVLTACHPLYSAAQRILVYGTLTKAEPRGAAKQAVERT
ncbi:MAG TPA: sortase [Microvirga sp.]|nr:sortase [Microvirga sp.]